MPLSNWEFRENRLIENHTLLEGTNAIFPRSVYIYLPTSIKFSTEDNHINLMSNCEFCEIQRSEDHSSIRELN
jgi:hypothetical protein